MTEPMDKPRVARHFREQADAWVRGGYDGGAYDYPTARHRARVVARLLKAAGRPLSVLDLGCGAGHLACALAEHGHSVLGVDDSPRMIELANQRLAAAPKAVGARLTFVQGDIETAEFEPGAFDAVMAMGVIGYLADDDKLLSLAAGALKPDGRFLVSCRNRLFNMVSLTHRTVREIESGAAPALIAEIQALARPVANAAARDMVAALAETATRLAADAGAWPPPAAPEAKTAAPVGAEARQHTPNEIADKARAHGFATVSFHGIHPHLIDPALNRLLPPGVFNALSGCLDALEDEPASLAWSSVFIAAFRNGGAAAGPAR